MLDTPNDQMVSGEYAEELANPPYVFQQESQATAHVAIGEDSEAAQIQCLLAKQS
ncbi:MAG: hypothetical protein J0H65_03415 [Rhizobiales bacterium]|nr:hypothetical protein [Hyphomicrobiales bacterium]